MDPGAPRCDAHTQRSQSTIQAATKSAQESETLSISTWCWRLVVSRAPRLHCSMYHPPDVHMDAAAAVLVVGRAPSFSSVSRRMVLQCLKQLVDAEALSMIFEVTCFSFTSIPSSRCFFLRQRQDTDIDKTFF